MRKIEWSRRARRDLERMRDYWFDRDPDYVESVLLAADRATEFLAETPAVGSPTDKPNIRKWRAGKSRYLLFYRHTKLKLTVVRVRHSAEDWHPLP